MKGDAMKVNAISSVEKHIKPTKLADFPTTRDEALANLFGQSDKDFVTMSRNNAKKLLETEKTPADFVEKAKKFFSNIFG